MHILLLGHPEVKDNDRPIIIRSETARALLIYLASQGAPVQTGDLLPLWWNSADSHDPLRDLLERLSELSDSLPTGVLEFSSMEASLDFERVFVDQVAFRNYIDQVGRLAWQIPFDQPLPEQTYHLLRKAAELWRSPRFLGGVELQGTDRLQTWQQQVAQEMEHLQSYVLQRLAEHHFTSGEFEESLRYARLALLNNPFNEDLHARVLQALARSSRRSEAQQHFRYLQNIFRRELDTVPSPKLVDLYRLIRETGPLSPVDESHPAWNVRPSMQTPFIGRNEEIQKLVNTYQNGGCCIILGESGQGKTRLLQEFTSRLELKPRLALAVCRPAENNLTYQPFIELLRHRIQADEWLALPAPWTSQLSLLLPEVETIRPNLERPIVEFAPDAGPGQARSLLMEAIRQVFVLLAKKQPILLCLDNAQWADEATLATIAYLAKRDPFTQQSAIMIAARAEERTPELDQLIDLLQDDNRTCVIHLAQLQKAEVVKLATLVLGQTPDQEFVDKLFADTGGNPLFILETLRALLAQEHPPSITKNIDFPLTASLQNLFQHRLQQLSPTARNVLEIAALIDTEFDPKIIIGVGLYSEEEILDALEELEARLLIEVNTRQTGTVTFRFFHNKVREALLQSINPLRARLIHGKIARVLQERYADSAPHQAAVLAHHFEQAGEYANAFHYWVQAGQRARQLFSKTDALHSFHQAESLLIMLPELTDQEIYSLYNEWTGLAYELDDADTLRQINTRMLNIGKERHSSFLIGVALIGLSHASMVQNLYEEGLDYTNEAIHYLEHTNALSQHMEAYNSRGVFLVMLERAEESVEAFQDALTLGSESSDPAVIPARANAHYQISVAFTLSGRPAMGLHHAMRSLSDFNSTNRTHGQVTAYSALALARFLLGAYEQALEDTFAGLQLAQRIGAARMLGYLHAYRAMTFLATGDSDRAWEHAQQALEFGDRYGHPEISAGGNRLMGDIFYWMTAYDRAKDYYQKAFQTSRNRFLATDHQFRLGLALCQTGQVEIGQRHVETAIQLSMQAGFITVTLLAQHALATVYLLTGRQSAAKQLLKKVRTETDRRGMKPLNLAATNLLGQCALLDGENQKAAGYLLSAATAAAEMSHPWLELQAQLMLQQAHIPETGIVSTSSSRIGELLDWLDARVKEPSIRPAYEKLLARATSPRLQNN